MSYSAIFSSIVPYLELCVTLAYLEPCHIENPGIFRSQDTFRILSRDILAYSERSVILASENPPILRTLPYSEFWHI